MAYFTVLSQLFLEEIKEPWNTWRQPTSGLRTKAKISWIGSWNPNKSVTCHIFKESTTKCIRIQDELPPILQSSSYSKITTQNIFNHLTPNDHYMDRTAQLTSRCCILYIYSTNIRTEYMLHNLCLFLFKMPFIS